jgi:hypothetical protein
MAASTRRQGRVNADAAASRRRSRRRSPSPHVSRSRSPAPSSSSSSGSPAPSDSPPSSASLKEADPKQIVETLITLVMRQRIKDVHQANMKHKLKQKLQRLKAQSAALNQSENNSMIKIIISQTSDTISSSDLCIQTMIFCYLFIDIIQLILIFKNKF